MYNHTCILLKKLIKNHFLFIFSLLACTNDQDIEIPNLSTGIYCVGDSLTEGGTPVGLPYPTYLQALVGNSKTVINEGHSGRESADLAVWTGGITPVLTSDLAIPTSTTPVKTTAFTSITIGKFRGYDVKGTLGKTHGILHYDEDTNIYSFTRSTEGPAITIPSGTEFISDGLKNLDKILIWWTGQNDLAFGWPYTETAPRDCALATINKMPSNNKRFLIISVTNGTTYFKNATKQQNETLKTAFPNNFVDLQNILIHDGLQMANITPTNADLEAISDERVPPSLLYDSVHFNDICKEKVIAVIIYKELEKRNWL